jgi:hypothetical protein
MYILIGLVTKQLREREKILHRKTESITLALSIQMNEISIQINIMQTKV